MFELKKPTALEKIIHPTFHEKQLQIFLKREDQIDPEVSGNKWRKLKYNFLEAQKLGYKTVLTFGGAFSNHIAATAAAARKYGFKSIGIIRGDELDENANPTLRKAHKDGMQLKFISRSQYQERENEVWLKELQRQYNAYVLPEGGTNSQALLGIEEMMKEIEGDFDVITCAVGTGGTLAGIVSGLKKDQKALGFATLKGESYLTNNVQKLISPNSVNNWTITDQYAFGGYAKTNDELIQFINEFGMKTGIPLDPIYTGKMMFGIFDLIEKGYFSSGCKIIAIHTGGLQGIEGFNEMND